MRRESSEKQEPTTDIWKLYVIFIGFFSSKISNFWDLKSMGYHKTIA